MMATPSALQLVDDAGTGSFTSATDRVAVGSSRMSTRTFLDTALGNLHDLHPAWSQVPDQGGGININAEVVKHGLGDLIHLFLVHQGAKLLAVADVLCSRTARR